MITVLRLTFWIGLLLPIAVYIGYPLVVRLIARFAAGSPIRLSAPWPTVTITIAAHNEERDIERAVRSCLAQPYPGPTPRILVGLDGCTDRTRAVLEAIGDPRVGYLDLGRGGKAATDNRLVASAASEIIVTTAAGSEFGPTTLVRLCEPFRDPSVGCVTGVFAPRVDSSAATRSEGGYWRMEQRLMQAESRLGMLAAASGTCMAHRRSIFRPIPLDSDGDVAIAPNAILTGLRVVFVDNAVVHDDGPPDLESVLRTRRRMALRALPTTATFIWRLLRAGRLLAAVGLIFHKLFRWLVPFAGLAWAISAAGLVLAGDAQYAVPGTVVFLGGGAAVAIAWLAGGAARGVVASFGVAQIAFALATVDALRGKRATMWAR